MKEKKRDGDEDEDDDDDDEDEEEQGDDDDDDDDGDDDDDEREFIHLVLSVKALYNEKNGTNKYTNSSSGKPFKKIIHY